MSSWCCSLLPFYAQMHTEKLTIIAQSSRLILYVAQHVSRSFQGTKLIIVLTMHRLAVLIQNNKVPLTCWFSKCNYLIIIILVTPIHTLVHTHTHTHTHTLTHTHTHTHTCTHTHIYTLDIVSIDMHGSISSTQGDGRGG